MRKRKEVQPISRKEKQFFEKLYSENKKYIYFLANKYVSSPEDCEDIFQDTIVRLLNNISSIMELSENKLRKYIALTVKAAFLDMEKRKHGIQCVPLDDNLMENLIKKEILNAESIPDISVNMAVDRLRADLPSRDWAILEGKYILGYSQEELGEMLGISPDSVRMALCRAKEKARGILQPER